MTPSEFLQQHAGKLRTHMGACFVGSHAVFREQDLHNDLKDIEWIDLYVFGITGRRFNKKQLRLMQAIWTTTSYPDARIWNNRVAALAGSARSTGNLGMAAALAVSEASIYGRGIDIRAIDFFIRTQEKIDTGCSLEDCVREELKNHRSIAGYGRPIKADDERLKPITSLASSLGLADGVYFQLAHQINEYLIQGRWRLRMNYGAAVAALGADLGLSPREYYLFMFPAFLAGMQPCFIETVDRPAGTFLPLSIENVHYEGTQKRTWLNRSN